MATLAPPLLRKFADDWENALPSAVLSGIVGDPAHQAEGGYHISREDQPGNNYSVQLAEDREGPSNYASAVDMNHDAAEMKLVTQRLLNSAKDANDPRLNYMREFYGTVDGVNVAGWDTYHGNPASSDRSHLWHVHISVLRKYCNDPVALAAILSVIKGQTYAQYLAGEGDTMTDDYGGYGRPPAIGDRPVPVLIADAWGQLMNESSPYVPNSPVGMAARLRNVEIISKDIQARMAPGGVDTAALTRAVVEGVVTALAPALATTVATELGKTLPALVGAELAKRLKD